MAQINISHKGAGPSFIQATDPVARRMGETWLNTNTGQNMVHDGIRWVPFGSIGNISMFHNMAGVNWWYQAHAESWSLAQRLPQRQIGASGWSDDGATPTKRYQSVIPVWMGGKTYYTPFASLENNHVYMRDTDTYHYVTDRSDPGGTSSYFNGQFGLPTGLGGYESITSHGQASSSAFSATSIYNIILDAFSATATLAFGMGLINDSQNSAHSKPTPAHGTMYFPSGSVWLSAQWDQRFSCWCADSFLGSPSFYIREEYTRATETWGASTAGSAATLWYIRFAPCGNRYLAGTPPIYEYGVMRNGFSNVVWRTYLSGSSTSGFLGTFPAPSGQNAAGPANTKAFAGTAISLTDECLWHNVNTLSNTTKEVPVGIQDDFTFVGSATHSYAAFGTYLDV